MRAVTGQCSAVFSRWAGALSRGGGEGTGKYSPPGELFGERFPGAPASLLASEEWEIHAGKDAGAPRPASTKYTPYLAGFALAMTPKR
jgi:hypothetical protein